MIYAKADAALQRLNRKNLRDFETLMLSPTDELNVIRSVRRVFGAAVRRAVKRLREIAEDSYYDALIDMGWDDETARRNATSVITPDWLTSVLDEYDAVTLYRFGSEAERKQQMLIEAMVASGGNRKAIEKALKAWSRQVGQYAITVTDRARLQAYADTEVPEVMWNTERDSKVCEVCALLDGMIFPLDKAPSKQHYNCRCWLTPVGTSQKIQPEPMLTGATL